MLELNDLPIKSNEINFMMTALVTNEKWPFSVPMVLDLGRAPTFKGGVSQGDHPWPYWVHQVEDGAGDPNGRGQQEAAREGGDDAAAMADGQDKLGSLADKAGLILLCAGAVDQVQERQAAWPEKGQ